MDYNFVGIDLGSKSAILSHLYRQYNNVVVNGFGDRETPVCISYSDQERHFGHQAVASLRSRPHSTVICPQRFITSDLKQLEI